MIEMFFTTLERFGLPVAMLGLFIWMYTRKDKENSELVVQFTEAIKERNKVIEVMANESRLALVENTRALEGLKVYMEASRRSN